MSRHLTTCAADLQLEPIRLKLALLCFAESARDKDHIALPGNDALAKWTGVKRAQVYNLIAALIEFRLIERQGHAHRGHRAEYRVFPLGCCEVHGKTPAMTVEDGAEVVALDPSESSTGPSMVFSTASDDDALRLDPLQRERVQSEPRKGLIGAAKGSNPDLLKGPVVPLKIGRLQELTPVVTTPQNPLHSGTDLQQLPPREPTPDDKPIDRRPTTAAALRADCLHCDNGQLHDRDGMPAGVCLRCSSARRRSTA